MAISPGPEEPNPTPDAAGPLRPAGLPPGPFPLGAVASWPTYRLPPPGREALIFARVMLGIQAALWTLGLLVAVLAFFDKPVPPGVTSQYGDLHSPSLSRQIITLLLTVAVSASTLTAAVRLAPARRRMWWLALATQTALVAIYGWLFTWMTVAHSPEGMASFAAVIIGPVAVAIPVIGLIALLLRSARDAVLDRSSRWETGS